MYIHCAINCWIFFLKKDNDGNYVQGCSAFVTRPCSDVSSTWWLISNWFQLQSCQFCFQKFLVRMLQLSLSRTTSGARYFEYINSCQFSKYKCLYHDPFLQNQLQSLTLAYRKLRIWPLISTQSNQIPPSIEIACPRSSISSDKMWKRKVYQWYKKTYRKQGRKPSGQFPLAVRADPTLTGVSSRKVLVKSNFLGWNQFKPLLCRHQVQFPSIVQHEYPYLQLKWNCVRVTHTTNGIIR